MAETSTNVPTITKEALAQRIRQGDVQVVNVLDPKYYDVEEVTYCAGYECHASSQAAQLLADNGFRVRAYEGGIKEWKDSGLPTEAASSSSASGCSCG